MTEDKKVLTRREALRNLALLAGAAAVPPVLSSCRTDVPSETAAGAVRTGALEPDEVPIEHVICIMMENRSFDNYFGTLSLNEGRTDIDGLVKGMSNLDSNGNSIGIYPMPNDEICVGDPAHGWAAWDIQSGGGKNDGFVKATADRRMPMSYLTRKQLPFLHALADDYALCQRWFCSVRGPTYPNRWYLHAGTSWGEQNNVDDGHDGEFIYDRLVENGHSWAYYYTDIPFLALAPNLLKRHAKNAPMRSIRRFFSDLRDGTLPTFSQLDAGVNVSDDHPPAHVGLGQQFMSSIYHALAESSYWNKCLFVITYDENGGFFDHVPPPKVEDDNAAKGFDQLGFRVPSVVAGPWIKPMVSSTLYDHTSVLAFLSWKFGISPLTKRSATANNLTDLLDVERIRTKAPRQAPQYAPVVVSPDELAVCKAVASEAPPADLLVAADRGLIPPHLDLRHENDELLRLLAARETGRFLALKP